ncbi:MAG: glycosyltransferase [Saprospiraceae bacterium]|nr:glycosyltransferase [Saprospiraceae bacterium]
MSVIICARNEAEHLRNNLPSVLQQQYAGEWELVVVNDNSSDETVELLDAFAATNNHLKVIHLTQKLHNGKKHALASGIQSARFDHVVVTDADCVPASRHWLARMAGCFDSKETEIVLGYGPLRNLNAGFWAGWSQFEAAFTALTYITSAQCGVPYMGVGRNLAFKKSVFEAQSGFEAHWQYRSGDDDLLVNAAANRCNTLVCLDAESFVFSTGAGNFKTWFKQKRRHLEAGVAYKPIHQVLLTLHAVSFPLFIVCGLLLFWERGGGLLLCCCFAVRYGAFSIAYSFGMKKLKEPISPLRILGYDCLLSLYFGVFVPLLLLIRKTPNWK